MIPTLERAIDRIWDFHFRLYWPAWLGIGVVLMAVAVFVPLDQVRFVAGVLAFLCFAGVFRWLRARRRCRGALLLVPRFYAGPHAGGRAEEAQRIIVDTLQMHLPHNLKDTVQPLPLRVGPDEQALAEKTRKRLRSIFVLHGRIAGDGQGNWSIFPSLLEPALSSTVHIDWFTHDRTPANPRFGPFVNRLVPQIGVMDDEFPFDFCRDLEALLRGVVGRIALLVGDFKRALELLDEALRVAGESSNPQIDALRFSRARAMEGLENADAAIDALTERAAGVAPSPALLRELAHMLFQRASRQAALGLQPRPEDRTEAIAALRLARSDDTDPQRDQSNYNLFSLLDRSAENKDEREEGFGLLDELLRSRTGYQKQWYVKRAAAVRAWDRVVVATTEGEEAEVRRQAAEAGKWYSRAIRARPRIQLDSVGLHWPPVRWHRIPQSPILYANANDAHRLAGHRLRARWLEWRFQRLRKRFRDRGMKALLAEEWGRAYAWFDWIGIVGRGDLQEAWAKTFAAVCLWRDDRAEEGEVAWNRARGEFGPISLLARASIAGILAENGIDPAVPGNEPTDMSGVTAEIDRRWPGFRKGPTTPPL